MAAAACNCASGFCQTCRDTKLQRYKNVGADVLKHLMEIHFPLKIEKDLNQLHKDTLESVAVAKACKTVVLQNSQFKYLKTHLKRVEILCDREAEKLANLINEGCRVYDNWEKIDFNLVQCLLIDRRRLSVNQLYRAQEFAWCLQYEDVIRKRNGKPTEPFYSEEKFERIKAFIKETGIIEDVDHDQKQITAMCSRLQRELVMNPR